MIVFGNVARDRVSGFTGIMTCKSHMLNGTVQLGLQPKVDPSKPELPDAKYFDEFQCEFVEEGLAGNNPPMDNTRTIELGDIVEDLVTGAKGTVTEIIEFQNGCVYLHSISKIQPEMKDPVRRYASHKQFKLIKAAKPASAETQAQPPAKPPGGPSRTVRGMR